MKRNVLSLAAVLSAALSLSASSRADEPQTQDADAAPAPAQASSETQAAPAETAASNAPDAPRAEAADAAAPAAPQKQDITAAAAPPAAPARKPPARLTGKLTLQAAIDTALSYNVESKIAGHQSRAARADALSARSALLPSVAFNASYGLNFDIPYGRDTDFYQSFNASLTANQLIYDFGKSRKRWHAVKAQASAAEHSSVATRRTVILNVRNAFFDVLEAQALVAVGEKTLENDEKHFEQTKELVDAGTRPTIDLAKLKSQVASARASLIQAQGNERIARAQLSFLLGQPISEGTEIVEPSLGELAFESQPPHELFEKALDNRPDLASQRAAISASRLQLESVESNLWPALYATAGAGWNWRHFMEPFVGFDVGLKLTWTIFDGFSNKGAKAAARENVSIEELRLQYQEQKIFTAIEEASLNVAAARAALAALDESLEAAHELLASAEERYAAGVGNIIELSDAQFDVAEAESKRVRGFYEVLSARAALLNAVGVEEWK